MKGLRKDWKVTVALLLSFVISFAIILFASVPERYDYSEGDICLEDIFAPREMEDRVSTENRRELAARQVEDQYSLNYRITEIKAEELGDALDTIGERKNAELSTKEKIGYVREYLSADITDDSIAYLMSMSGTKYSAFSRNMQIAFREVMEKGVEDEGTEAAIEEIIEILREKETAEALIQAAREILENYVVVNMDFDKELTQKRRDEAKESVEPVIYKENQKIAEAGVELNRAQIQLLSDIGMLKGEGKGINVKYAVGIFVFMLTFYGIAIYYIKLKSGRKRLSEEKLILASLLPAIMLFMLFLSGNVGKVMSYMLPVPWCSILMATFVSLRLSAITSVYLSFAAAIMLGLPEDYIIAMVIFSAVSSVIFKRVDSISGYAKAMFYVAAIGFASMSVAMLVTGRTWQEIIKYAVAGGLNGALSSILVIGTTPIFENIFNIVTPFKLNDLGNPEKPLLKRLMFEAPGTYHHCLMVGNLAEAACIKIGANNQLARVAAYYHDIGKLRRPGYFFENQMGANPHDTLMPRESSDVLKGHVEDGIEIAKQYRLPTDILDIIKQHHGKTVTGFFYKKEKELNPDASKEEFRYPGPRPESKEAGIVMLADSCEAAVRSLDEKNEETIRAMVTKIVKHRMAEGELDDCDLSFRELGEIIEAFVSMLGSHFHKRIKYDEKEQPENGTDNRENA